MGGLAQALVGFALRRRWLMVGLLAAVVLGGAVAFLRLDVEAYPDPVPPLVDIIAQSPSQSAEEVERYVTIPLETQLAGLPHLAAIRTISLFGLSDVKLQFTFDVSYQQAEQSALNVLAQITGLPSGVTPQISPWSPIGEIYRYRVVGPPGMPPVALREVQDGIVESRLKAIPGVIDVNSWGGPTRAIIASVDLDKLNAAGVTLPQILTAIGNNDQNVGGRTIPFGAHAAVVRGVGLIRSPDDLRDTLVSSGSGSPVLLRDVAKVADGIQPRLGIVGQDADNDIVQGIVLMRRGERSLPTIRAVAAEVRRINSSGMLPQGVRLVRIYDRSELIGITTRTVLTNLAIGIALIFLVQWLFLGDLRSALVVGATVPFALAFAVGLLVLRGESANLLSVGAIDFGLIVDATVILVENIFRHLHEAAARRGGAPASRYALILQAVAEVDRAVFFSAAIIFASFVPLFTLAGIEGHIFGPMARTYAYAIAGALIATFTVSPALAALLLPEGATARETAPVRTLRRLYAPVLEFMLANGVLALGAAAWLAVLAGAAAWSLGLEFLPHLEERNLWVRATMPQSISLEAAETQVEQMRATLRRVPEVTTVISQLGRPDDGTDATGFFNAEFYVPLKPRSEWRHGIWTKEEMTERIEAELRGAFPGVGFNFSQYIEDNVEEAASGVKGENAVKLYGSDLKTLEDTAVRVRDAMRTVFGITDLAIFNALGQLTLSVETDRARAAKFGLAPADIDAVVQTGIGGQVAGSLYPPDSAATVPILVRLAPRFREDPAAIGNITLPAPAAGNLPVALRDLARISLANGPAFIYRENQERYVPIKFSVRFRPLGSAVHEAQQRVAALVKLPPGVRLQWVGEYSHLQVALRRLAVVVPLSLALVGLLLLAQFGSLRDALVVASVLPMALVGGLFALALSGTPFSVSAAIGFVGLFGVAVMEGLIILAMFNALVDGGSDPAAALRRACALRLRPVLMTCLAAGVGLLPAAVSRGIGAQVQGPFAIVVVGGSLLAPALILLLLPVLIQRLASRAAPLRRAGRQSAAARSST